MIVAMFDLGSGLPCPETGFDSYILTSPQKLGGLSRAPVTLCLVAVTVIVKFICDSFEHVIVQRIVDLC